MFTRIRSPGRMLAALAAGACALFVVGLAPAQAADPPQPGDIYANMSARSVDMHGWPDGSTLRATIDDNLSYVGPVSSDGSGSLAWHDVDLAPGQHIVVEVIAPAGMDLSREMYVGPIAVIEVDYANDTVSGIAHKSISGGDPFVAGLVQICAGWQPGDGPQEIPEPTYSCRWVPTDDTISDPGQYGQEPSTWTADFGVPQLDRGGEKLWPAFDLVPYWQGVQVSQAATPLQPFNLPANMTLNDPPANPYLDVQYRLDWDPPASGKVVAYAFDVGSEVAFALSKGGDVTCMQTAEVSPAGTDADGWQHWLPYALFDPWLNSDPSTNAAPCNPQPGDLLSAQGLLLGQELTKQLTVVTPLDGSGSPGVDADFASDLVSGEVPAGYDVEVTPWDDGDTVRLLIAPSDEWFTADFAAVGYDVQPWSRFGIQVLDPQGDRVDTQLRSAQLWLEVVPNRYLGDGQEVTVRGGNFTPGYGLAVQGYGFSGGLDDSTYEPVLIGPDGSFETTYVVRRVLTVPTGPEHTEFVEVDCLGLVAPDSCFIAVMSESGDDYQQAWTEFHALTISLVSSGTLSKVGGRVTVSGAVSCAPGDTAQVTGSLRQRVGRKSLATGAFSVAVPCSTGTWSAVVSPESPVPFGIGKAELTATAAIGVGSGTATEQATQVITVKAPPKR